MNTNAAAEWPTGEIPTGSFQITSPNNCLAEDRKETVNLRPALHFIEKRLETYEDRWRCFTNSQPSNEGERFAHGIQFADITEQMTHPRLAPEQIAGEILPRLPHSLLALSRLTTVSYAFANRVILPRFTEDGRVEGAAESVLATEFPRSGDHPSRILIGCTELNGKTIYLTALPSTVTENKRAGWFYQLHVFLHELFHTVELPRRVPTIREKVVLLHQDEQFTLQQWWKDWKQLFESGREPYFVTRYAEAYRKDLIAGVPQNQPERYDAALAEQICESFAAYILGIAPNDRGWTEFRREDFGNPARANIYRASFEAGNRQWTLMNRLCSAQVVSVG